MSLAEEYAIGYCNRREALKKRLIEQLKEFTIQLGHGETEFMIRDLDLRELIKWEKK